MFKNLRVGWRQFIADPGYTAVILLGLSVAIASCYLTAQVVFNEVLPDPDVPQPDRVVNFEFRSNDRGTDPFWYDQAPFVLAAALRQSRAPVSAVARSLDGHSYVVHAGERSARLGLEFADPDLIGIFGLRTVAGDLQAAFTRPDAIALTAASAQRLFPGGHAIGKTVTVHDKVLTVVAVTTDRTGGDEQSQDGFVMFESPLSKVSAETLTSWGAIEGRVFARVADGFTVADAGAAAQALFEKSPAMKREPGASQAPAARDSIMRAMPLTRQYLEGGPNAASQRRRLLGMVGGALLMLVLAVANYVNLTSVRTLARTREIAVRKTLGAGPWRLTAQFMTESALAAGVASAFGLLLAWWLAPTLGHLLYMRLADGLFAPGRLVLLAGGAVALGIVSGLYPARIALGVDCGTALAGRSHDEGRVGRGLRRAMMALQFAFALVITAACGAMQWQGRYVDSLPHGIRTTGLLTVDLPDGFSGRSNAINAAFREALTHEPGVTAMSWSMDVPGRGQAWQQMKATGANTRAPFELSMMPVDVDFFQVFDVPLLAGRLRTPPAPSEAAPGGSTPEKLLVIDAATSRALGFATPRDAIDQVVLEADADATSGHQAYRIVAVAADVRMEQAHDRVRLHSFGLTLKPQDTLTLQGPRMEALQQALDRVWPRFFPEDTLEPETIPEALGLPYLQERRLTQMASATTCIALLLSGFGVYALAAYTVRRSAREIVVRKLYGAGRARVARLMAGEFLPLLVVAALLGLPIAAWLAHGWLEGFTERSPTVYWVLPAALLALVAMTTLAALRHGLIAMNMRPTLALRD